MPRSSGVSVRLVEQRVLLDLDYWPVQAAELFLQEMMSGRELLVEVRGSAKGASLDGVDLDGMLDLARIGTCKLLLIREQALDQRVS